MIRIAVGRQGFLKRAIADLKIRMPGLVREAIHTSMEPPREPTDYEIEEVARAITACYATSSDWRLRLRQARAAAVTLRGLGWRPPPASPG